MRTKLSVNINKVALIRNSRNNNYPDLVQFALDCESYGADGITVHPRPDQRHIRYADLPILKSRIATEFNIEGFPSKEFMDHVLTVQPDQCTLVPDPPGALTSDSGWDVKNNVALLSDIVSQLHESGIRVALFLNADEEQLEYVATTNADRIELYTGNFAMFAGDIRAEELEKHVKCSNMCRKIGIGVNAGHDLNLDNLKHYKQSLSLLNEVSIGHAIVCDSLYYGIENVIGMYKNLLR